MLSNLLQNVNKAKTVDSIMEPLFTAITNLRDLSVQKALANDEHVAEIDRLQKKVVDNHKEASRADSIANKLEGLLR